MLSALKSYKRQFPENADKLRQGKSSPAEMESWSAEDIEPVNHSTGSGAASTRRSMPVFVEINF